MANNYWMAKNIECMMLESPKGRIQIASDGLANDLIAKI